MFNKSHKIINLLRLLLLLLKEYWFVHNSVRKYDTKKRCCFCSILILTNSEELHFYLNTKSGLIYLPPILCANLALLRITFIIGNYKTTQLEQIELQLAQARFFWKDIFNNKLRQNKVKIQLFDECLVIIFQKLSAHSLSRNQNELLLTDFKQLLL